MTDETGWQLDNDVRKIRLLTNARQLLNFCLKIQVQNKIGKSPRLKRGDTIFACGYHERVILTDCEIQMIHKLLICYLLVSVLLVSRAWSQERAIRPATSKASTGARQALAIGNSEYEYAGRQRNLVNDDRVMGNTLQQLGFKVNTLTKTNQPQIGRSIKQLGRQPQDSKRVRHFYYADHGVQFDGEN